MIDNLINGNLKEAKQQAKRFSEGKIRFYLIDLGWSVVKSTLAASYLKGNQSAWQDYCNAK